jgi:hypothetical protein
VLRQRALDRRLLVCFAICQPTALHERRQLLLVDSDAIDREAGAAQSLVASAADRAFRRMVGARRQRSGSRRKTARDIFRL